ncbi:MAG: S8 family serine peptidase, partial [Proteobacteria bacterium]|nr:S8 family serine peptidase [Pseudomonadota bacterium]
MTGRDTRSDQPLQETEILVRFKAATSHDQRQTFSADLGFKQIRSYDRFRIHRWQISKENISMEEALAELRKNPRVEFAEPNYRRYLHRTPNDPMFDSQWHLENTGQSGGTSGADIEAATAWNRTTGSSRVVVAVLDSGIEYTHPDLEGNMWKNSREDWLSADTPGYNGVDDDHNGYIDDYYGINAADNTGDPMDIDDGEDGGHGTHVAGIIGAVGNNAVGVTGINWNAGLMALKFFGLGPQSGTVAGIVECVDYILDQKAKGVPIYIVNASFGGSDYSQFEKEAYEALRDQGILLAVSAGNSGADLDSERENFPGSYYLENIINVA